MIIKSFLNKVCFLSIYSCFCCYCESIAAPPAQGESQRLYELEKPGRDLWDSLLQSAEDQERVHAKTGAYNWEALSERCRKATAMLRHAKYEQIKPSIRYFIGEFGKHGNIADMCWLLSSPELTLPLHTSRSFTNTNNGNAWIHVIDAFDEEIAKKMLVDRDFLKRYYYAVVWSQRMFGDAIFMGGHISTNQLSYDAAELENHRKYWWSARKTVLYLYAFNKDSWILPENQFKNYEKYRDLLNWGDRCGWKMKLMPCGIRWTNNADVPANVIPNPDVIVVTRPRIVLPKLDFPKSPFNGWTDGEAIDIKIFASK